MPYTLHMCVYICIDWQILDSYTADTWKIYPMLSVQSVRADGNNKSLHCCLTPKCDMNASVHSCWKKFSSKRNMTESLNNNNSKTYYQIPSTLNQFNYHYYENFHSFFTHTIALQFYFHTFYFPPFVQYFSIDKITSNHFTIHNTNNLTG